ncbi:arginine--tRNA ligase [Candidatus Marinamargulisbacteria bacterium SCGC AG-343-K17]|nr:arginine--tRNA ligase [Candidatus Marinamargulisbacteria bacterium SCGC AG-343-K17]
MSLKRIVQETIKSCLDDATEIKEDIEIDIPRIEHGDYALNIAFKLAKMRKRNPHQIADELSEVVNNKGTSITAESASGFINVKLDNNVLFDYFITFLNQPPKVDCKDKILLEYVSANPTGPLHIGHGRWAVIGDTLFRLLTTVGINVTNEFYINDAGNQINLFNQSIEAKRNNQKMPENGYGGHFIDYVIKENKGLSNVDFVIEHQKKTLHNLRCEFNEWFKETKLHQKDILEEVKKEYGDYIYEKEGAIWFRTTDFNDDKDRVIRKENGDLTYFAADIMYHMNKINRGFSHLVNIWGADHHGYIKRIESSIKAKNDDTKLTVILGQLVHLFKNGEPVKMSKRTGELIELSEVIEEIGVDATRYFLLDKKPEQTLDFDLNIASEKSMENPVYYIQYAHARICTIIEKTNGLDNNNDLTLNEMDRKLMLHGARYYDALYEASHHYEPYKLTQYLHELAKIFHSFYQKNHIINDSKIHQQRLQIIQTTKKIIQHCSNILGISTPEKM